MEGINGNKWTYKRENIRLHFTRFPKSWETQDKLLVKQYVRYNLKIIFNIL